MNMTDRVYSLLRRHQKLDEQLHRAKSRLWADPFEIARLKKLKLAVKDRLARLAGPRTV